MCVFHAEIIWLSTHVCIKHVPLNVCLNDGWFCPACKSCCHHRAARQQRFCTSADAVNKHSRRWCGAMPSRSGFATYQASIYAHPYMEKAVSFVNDTARNKLATSRLSAKYCNIFSWLCVNMNDLKQLRCVYYGHYSKTRHENAALRRTPQACNPKQKNTLFDLIRLVAG